MSYVVEGLRILFRTKPGKRYEASGEILTASAGVAVTYDLTSSVYIVVEVRD